MQTLDDYRHAIDRVDEELLAVLARRFRVCADIAQYKRRFGIMQMHQPARATFVKEQAIRAGHRLGLDESFLGALFDLILEEACRLGDQIIGDGIPPRHDGIEEYNPAAPPQ